MHAYSSLAIQYCHTAAIDAYPPLHLSIVATITLEEEILYISILSIIKNQL